MNKNPNISDEDEFSFFENLKVPHNRPKEDIWEELAKSIDKEPQQKKSTVFQLKWIKVAAAVILLIGIGSLSFMRIYSIDITSQKGEFTEHILPDGSQILLNAETSISYHPYWWSFSRELEMEGEAFFEVKKGNKFQVNSANGSTQVLGTSFNIYARNDEYTVYCRTGKVRVSHVNSTQILKPGDYTLLIGNELEKSIITEDEAISWKLGKFIYNTTALDKVFDDFERQYGVNIKVKNSDIYNLNYTGMFDRNISAEEALEMICLTFDLDYEKISNFTYVIQ